MSELAQDRRTIVRKSTRNSDRVCIGQPQRNAGAPFLVNQSSRRNLDRHGSGVSFKPERDHVALKILQGRL
jgi:hypothetical protein